MNSKYAFITKSFLNYISENYKFDIDTVVAFGSALHENEQQDVSTEIEINYAVKFYENSLNRTNNNYDIRTDLIDYVGSLCVDEYNDCIAWVLDVDDYKNNVIFRSDVKQGVKIYEQGRSIT